MLRLSRALEEVKTLVVSFIKFLTKIILKLGRWKYGKRYNRGSFIVEQTLEQPGFVSNFFPFEHIRHINKNKYLVLKAL